MDTFEKRVYVGEIKKQCEFSLAAIQYLNNALQQLNNREIKSEERNFFHSEVFRQMHSLLTHASNVSRMFWPPMPKQRKNETDEDFEKRLVSIDKVVRGRVLKTEFEIDDSNPLKNRALRDHLEHYDERLDHWRNNSTHKNIVSDTIGPPNAIVGPEATDMMRWFDPTRNVFMFRGEEYDIQSIATATDNILSIALGLEKKLWDQQCKRT